MVEVKVESYNELQNIVYGAQSALGVAAKDVPGAIWKLKRHVRKLERRLNDLGEPIVPTEEQLGLPEGEEVTEG